MPNLQPKPEDEVENLLYALVMQIEPDDDGSSQYDSQDEQEAAGKDAVDTAKAKILALLATQQRQLLERVEKSLPTSHVKSDDYVWDKFDDGFNSALTEVRAALNKMKESL